MELKLVLIGNPFVGKTCIVNRAVNNVFEKSISTAGTFYTSKVVRDDIKLHIWDTAGSEKYKSIVPMYYREANIILLVYSVDSSDSFSDLDTWYQSVQDNAPQNITVILVGNKSDVDSSERQVTTEQGEEYARRMGMHFYEVSAKSGAGIDELFEEAPKYYLEAYPKDTIVIMDSKQIVVVTNRSHCKC